MSEASEREALLPCPFCGAGTTDIQNNGRMWTGQKMSEPTSVSVRHWCEKVPGQPARMIERVGRDRASAIAAWNRRDPVSKPTPVAADPVRCAGCDLENGCPEYCLCAPATSEPAPVAAEPAPTAPSLTCSGCDGCGYFFGDECARCHGLGIEPAHVAAEPFAYYIYIRDQQTGYYVDDLDDAIDDLTNCECEVTPLYATPAAAMPAEPEQP